MLTIATSLYKSAGNQINWALPCTVSSDGLTVTMYQAGDQLPAEYLLPGVEARIVAISDFWARWTDAEIDLLTTLAYGGDVIARRALHRFNTMQQLNLVGPDVIAFMDYLVSKAVITAARERALLRPIL